MKEFVEKLIERLEEEKKSYEAEHAWNYAKGLEYAVSIVNQLAEEYKGNLSEKLKGWIPCTEKLPEEETKVIVSTKMDVVRVGTYTKRYGYCMEEGFICEDIFMYMNTALAWQPLPSPYNPEEKPKFSNEELDRIMDKILDNQDLDKLKQEPKTRIEHIRSMSVEELADAIMERSEISTVIDFCQKFCGECEHIPESECRKCLIKYLNSPVEQKKIIPTDHFKERFNRVL